MDGIFAVICKPFAYFTMVNYMLGHQVAVGAATNDHDHLAAGDVSLLSATVLPPLGCIGLFGESAA